MAFDYTLHDAQMAEDIRQEISDSAQTFEVLLSNMQNSAFEADEFEKIKRDVNNLSLLCAGINDRLIDLLMHRFSNYIGQVDHPTANQLDDFGIFVDMMGALVSGEIELSSDPAEFVRSLPVLRPPTLTMLRTCTSKFWLSIPRKRVHDTSPGNYRIVAFALPPARVRQKLFIWLFHAS